MRIPTEAILPLVFVACNTAEKPPMDDMEELPTAYSERLVFNADSTAAIMLPANGKQEEAGVDSMLLDDEECDYFRFFKTDLSYPIVVCNLQNDFRFPAEMTIADGESTQQTNEPGANHALYRVSGRTLSNKLRCRTRNGPWFGTIEEYTNCSGITTSKLTILGVRPEGEEPVIQWFGNAQAPPDTLLHLRNTITTTGVGISRNCDTNNPCELLETGQEDPYDPQHPQSVAIGMLMSTASG